MAKLDDLRRLPETFLERQAKKQVEGEQEQEWYYKSHKKFHNIFRGDSTRSTKSPTSKGVRADGPKIFYDRATQWEQMTEWTVNAGTQTEYEQQIDVREEEVGVVD